MRLKKLTAVLLTSVMLVSVPTAAFAGEDVSSGTALESVLSEEQEEMISSALDTYGDDLAELAGSPEKVADIIVYLKEQMQGVELSDDEILSIVNEASEQFGITFTEEEKGKIVQLARKFQDLDIDAEKLTATITSVYESLGFSNKDVKGIAAKFIQWVKGLFD